VQTLCCEVIAEINFLIQLLKMSHIFGSGFAMLDLQISLS
jgi:hypothetical protein